MNKMTNLKISVLVLGVLLSSASFAADEDPSLARQLTGGTPVAPGLTVQSDVCECNTVGGTLAGKPKSDRYDYMLPGDAAPAVTPSGGAGGVDN